MTRRLLRGILQGLGALLGAAVLLFAGLAWRLAEGPIELGFATPHIEAAINDPGAGLRFAIDEAALAWSEGRDSLEITARGVEALDAGGEAVAATREAVFDIALAPLLRGEIRPRGVAFVQPAITARREPDGAFRLALSPPDAADGNAVSGDPAPLADLLSLARAPLTERLTKLEFRDADLWIEDPASGVVWHAAPATLSVERVAEGLALDATMAMNGEESAFDLTLAARHRAASGETELSALLDGVDLSDLAEWLPGLPDMGGVSALADGRLDLAFDRDFRLSSGSFSIHVPDGGRIALEGVFEAPVFFGPSRASGVLGQGFSSLALDDIHVGIEAGSVEGRMAIDGFGPDGRVEGRIDVRGLPVDDLRRYWPVALAPRGRAWVVNRVSSGVMETGTLAFESGVAELAGGGFPLSRLTIEAEVTGAAVEPPAGLSPVLGVEGRVSIADDAMRIELRDGRSEGLRLTHGVVAMDRLDHRSAMQIDLDIAGGVANALALVGARFAPPGGLGVDPAAAAGDFRGRLELSLPRLAGLQIGEVSFRAAAELEDVAVEGVLPGYRLDGGRGTLEVDAGAARLAGAVRVNGVPFDAELRHDFAPDAEIVRRVVLRGAVDDGARAALGLALPFRLTGAADIALDAFQMRDGTAGGSVAADLEAVEAEIPAWIAKAPGEPGSLALELRDDGGEALLIDSFALDIPGASIRGGGALGGAGSVLARLHIDRFRIGRTDARGFASVHDDGLVEIALSGGVVDLAPTMDRIAAPDAPPLPPLQLRGRLDRVWTGDRRALDGVEVAGLLIDDRWEQLELTGRLAGGSALAVDIWRVGANERRFEYRAGDAGAALSLLDLFEGAQGGSLSIEAGIDDARAGEPVATGALRMNDIVFGDAPILARIVALASIESLVNALRDDGLRFDRAAFPFRKTGGRLEIENACMIGPGLGVTLEGAVDLDSGRLDLRGVIVPAYELNAAIDWIPLIGDLLTGLEEAGGIFAFTFDIEGPRDDPVVSVNPLSVLAPGILRNILGALIGGGDRADDELKAPEGAC